MVKITAKLKGIENIRKEGDKTLAEEIKKQKAKTKQAGSGTIDSEMRVDSSPKIFSALTVSSGVSLRKKP
jgi:hypothetical protein